MLLSSTMPRSALLLLLLQRGCIHRPALSRPHCHLCSAALEDTALAELSFRAAAAADCREGRVLLLPSDSI